MTELQAKAEALIVAWSGVTEWRPLFVLGLMTVAVVAVAVTILVIILWGLRK